MDFEKGTILRINIKPNREGERGLPKSPVPYAKISSLGIEGDYNRFRTERKQGTLSRALLILTTDRIRELRGLGWPVQFGHLGENLTVSGLTYDSFDLGQEYLIEGRNNPIRIRIEEKANPCVGLSNLPYVGQDKIKEFMQTLLGRRGWYASVSSREGEIRMNDLIRRVS